VEESDLAVSAYGPQNVGHDLVSLPPIQSSEKSSTPPGMIIATVLNDVKTKRFVIGSGQDKGIVESYWRCYQSAGYNQ
jgi:hypothetical protein